MVLLKNKAIRRTVVTGLLILLIFELVIMVSEGFRVQSEEKELYKHSYAVESEVEKIFLNVYTVSEAYMSFIEQNLDVSLEDNEAFLNHLMQHEEIYVRNIAYIEDTTIKFNYPHEENSSSIGVDLSLVDGQKEDVLFVKSSMEALLIGPVTLVQGGQAYILRNPVVIDDVYHGQISTVIDADELNLTLNEEIESYGVSMIITDQNGVQVITIGDDFDQNSVSIKIEDKYLNWDLHIYDKSDELSDAIMRHIIRLIGIVSAVIVCNFVYKNRKLHEKVLFKANHDSLTNDFNRTKFVEDYNSGIFTGNLIAFTDINKFKILNDTLGHQFGDWGLISISKKFNRSGKFITYRISGDEFVIVTKEPMNEREFLDYVKEFNSTIYNEQLNQDILITLSIGVIETIPSELTLESMLMYLDYAMYDAKKAKKTYTVVNDKLMKKYADQKIVEDTIIHDINTNNLHTYYQPIINIQTEKVEGVEALSRWMRDGKIVPASKFIDIVKKIKYIEKVDQNLFNNMQSEYLELQKETVDTSSMYFAINLSAETLKMFENNYLKFDEFVKDRVIPKEKLIFEISEDINLGIISAKTLEYIKNQGYSLSIDDFGSGVSKLTDVLSGQILAIKTDKSMIPASVNETKKWRAFNTIIKAINASGSKVCVEGVETKEQLRIATKANVTSVQGYLFSKPVPYNDLVAFVSKFSYVNYKKDNL